MTPMIITIYTYLNTFITTLNSKKELFLVSLTNQTGVDSHDDKRQQINFNFYPP